MNITYRLLTKLLLTLALLTVSPLMLALDQFTLPFAEIVVCPSGDGYGEEIYLEGTARFQIKYIEGTHHTSSFFNIYWKADGYGMTSGAEYILRGKWMEVVQGIEESSPFIFLWNDHFQLIGKGKAENFDLYFKVRFVVNANGEVTVDFLDEAECETVWFEIG